MVELIVGKKGKGKTKVLLDKVNSAVKEANGSIVYLDKSTKHMYELNNKGRLNDVSGFPIKNADELAELGTTAGDKIKELGVEAKDKKTLQVTLSQPCPYFLEIMTFTCFYPQNQKFVD